MDLAHLIEEPRVSQRSDLPIVIAGGGIGGLALAGVLEQCGIAYQVLEQAEALTEIGAGIQIAPNGVHVLRHLGIEAVFAEKAGLPVDYHARDWKAGDTLYRAPRNPGFAEKYGAPYYQVHRADLLDALKSVVPAEKVQLGTRVSGIAETDGRVWVSTADGQAIEARAIVGADGVHSAVRQSLYGAQAPTYAGFVVYRLTVPMSNLPPHFRDIGSSTFHGPNSHVTVYPIYGETLVNCALSVETDNWEQESWSLECGKDEVRQAFVGWHKDILTLIDTAERINKWALFDRVPFPQWSRGRATLIGDAAHPMLPFLAQGACMAIEDAYVLGACLSAAGTDVKSAFERYEALRWARTSRVMQTARARVGTMHEASALRRLLRNLNYWISGLTGRSGKRFSPDWIYELNVVRDHPIQERAEKPVQ